MLVSMRFKKRVYNIDIDLILRLVGFSDKEQNLCQLVKLAAK